MGPSRKSRSVNKQFANEVAPKKLAESPNKNGHKVSHEKKIGLA